MGGSASTSSGSSTGSLSQKMSLPGMEGFGQYTAPTGYKLDPVVQEMIARYGVVPPAPPVERNADGRIITRPTQPPAYPTRPRVTRPGTRRPTTPTTPPVAPPRQFSWQFPQYSQTWAFTPPTPSSFTLPPMFNLKSLQGRTSGSGTAGSVPRTWNDAYLAAQRWRPDGVNATMDPRTA